MRRQSQKERYSSKRVDPLTKFLQQDPQLQELSNLNAELYRSENNGSQNNRIKFPTIERFQQIRNGSGACNVAPKRSIQKIYQYKKKVFDPQSCARNHKLNYILVHKVAESKPQNTRKFNINKRYSQSKSHNHLMSVDSSIETVPLSFLVYQNIDRLNEEHYRQK